MVASCFYVYVCVCLCSSDNNIENLLLLSRLYDLVNWKHINVHEKKFFNPRLKSVLAVERMHCIYHIYTAHK